MTTGTTPGALGSNDQLGLATEREVWVRRWFEQRYQAGDVFHDGAEALTLDGAMQLVADAQAADRERIIAAMPGGHSVDPQWVADMVRGLRA